MINKLIANREYIKVLSIIEELEQNREFCKHGMEHSLDVARIGYIINLEEGFNLEKEMIYLAALLHDIGRSNLIEGIEHHHSGVELAKDILEKIGYPLEKANIICNAIKNHKFVEEGQGLDYVIFKADKLSRACYNCSAIKECYWADNIKNHKLTI